MSENKAQKMGNVVTQPTKEKIGKMQNDKALLQALGTELDKHLREISQEVRQAVNISISNTAKGPKAFNLDPEILKAAAKELGKNIDQLRNMNQDARVAKVDKILLDTGVVTPRSNKP